MVHFEFEFTILEKTAKNIFDFHMQPQWKTSPKVWTGWRTTCLKYHFNVKIVALSQNYKQHFQPFM